VVSLSKVTPQGWRISFVDIVENRRRYFHAAEGGGWPKTPPNYIGWRYGGKLQGIAHVISYEILPDMYRAIPEVPKGAVKNHVLYRLGRAFRPSRDVPSGKLYRNGRCWCMLDTLFTARSIALARDESKRREVAAKRLR
jgi:hypothetical protein